MSHYDENNYLAQNRDWKFFYKENVGESMLSLIITHDKIEKLHPFQIFDLRF